MSSQHPPSVGSNGPPAQGGRLLAAAIIGSQFTPPFMFSGVAIALPSMGRELGAGATALGLVETLFLAGSLALLLPIGRFADASDKRTLYKLGLFSFAATSLLVGTLSWMPAILFIRFLQGVTSALVAVTGPAILAEIVPPARRGRAFGASLAAIYGGLAIGPIVAGLLVDAWGWRAVFVGGGTIILGGFVLTSVILRATWRHGRGAVHWPSTALVVSAVLCLVGGTASLSRGPLGAVAIAGGLALAVAFVLVQRRLERPLLDVAELRHNAPLGQALLVQLLLYVNAFTTVFLLSLYLQVTLGQSGQMAGQVLATGTVVMALLAPVAGALADRVRPSLVASVGVAAVLVSSLVALTLDAHSSPARVVLLLAIQGVGFGLFSSPNMAIIMGSAPPGRMSMASALGAKARSLGMVTGMLVTGTLIAVLIGNDPVAEHPAQLVSLMHTAFAILAVLTALSLAVSVFGRVRTATATSAPVPSVEP